MERVQEQGHSALMREGRRWCHEQLAVDELVPRRVQRTLGDELADLVRGPTTLCCGHGHNVLGSAVVEQEVIHQHAVDEAVVRHHFLAAA